MKIFFLDDNTFRQTSFREDCPKEHTVFIAKDYRTAINVFTSNGPFDILFLDHDLGQKQTGLDFVKWILDGDINAYPTRVIVHSNSPVGASNMVYLLQDFNIKAYWSMFVPSRRWVNEQLAILNANP